MSVALLTAVATCLIGWSLVSGRLERLDVSGPVLFVLLGLVLCNSPVLGLDVSVEAESVHLLAEVTLVLLLFADASQVDAGDLRRDTGLPARLLGLGLPLTFAAGFGLAAALFTSMPWELAALLGAVLAPTDAALSDAVVSDDSLPVHIRRSLNVESGLNDGIATPAVTSFLASAATVIGVGAYRSTVAGAGMSALVDLVGGIAVGAAVGGVGGWLIGGARRRGWMAPGSRRIAVLGLALLAFSCSADLDVNYFVAAFVAGFAFRAATGPELEEATELPELLGRILALGVWFVFGAAMLLPGLKLVDWRIAVYAVASLTVIRMVPVAVALIGSGTRRADVLFIGWFGPRGLASVVFGLLVIEELPRTDPMVQTVLSTVVLTVALSVVAHGISARPLSARLAHSRPPA